MMKIGKIKPVFISAAALFLLASCSDASGGEGAETESGTVQNESAQTEITDVTIYDESEETEVRETADYKIDPEKPVIALTFDDGPKDRKSVV